MSKSTIALVAFLAGCGVTALATVSEPLVIPTAHAQTTQRWEVFCVMNRQAVGEWPENMSATATRAGAEGWELVGFQNGAMCFKRPAP